MITFWLSAIVLVVLASFFFWLPFINRKQLVSVDDDIDRNALNIEIFKGRVAELQKELDDGNLDQESFLELKRELEQNLLEEVDDAQQTGKARRLPLVLPAALSVLVPLLAVLLYLQWGESQKLDLAPEMAASPQEQLRNSDIDTQIEALKAQLDADPGNAEGWFMLARTYLTLERYQQAYDAFTQLTSVVGEHPQILSQQAQALYLLNGSTVNAEVQTLIDRALALDPNDPGTLGFLGMTSFESGDYKQAIDYWQQTLNSGNPNVNAEGLQSAIQQAQAELAKQGIVYQPKSVPTVSAANGAELSIRVDLDESLKSMAKGDTTVFVYAQAVSGPKMPLAAVRIQVKDLPATVKLNDNQAMGPMAKLSSAEQVNIRAMVSHSGTATSQKGDFYGVIGPIEVANNQETMALKINQLVE